MEVGDLVKLVVSLPWISGRLPKAGDIVIVKYISGSSILISDFSGNFYRRRGGYKTYFRKDDFRLLSEIRNEKIDEIMYKKQMESKVNTELIPVIHMVNENQVLTNVETCLSCGIEKVFIINHQTTSEELIKCAKRVKETYPGLWVGINMLDKCVEDAILYEQFNFLDYVCYSFLTNTSTHSNIFYTRNAYVEKLRFIFRDYRLEKLLEDKK